MAAVDFVTGYITDQVDGFVRPYVAQGAAMVGDFAGGLMYSVCLFSNLSTLKPNYTVVSCLC